MAYRGEQEPTDRHCDRLIQQGVAGWKTTVRKLDLVEAKSVEIIATAYRATGRPDKATAVERNEQLRLRRRYF